LRWNPAAPVAAAARVPSIPIARDGFRNAT